MPRISKYETEMELNLYREYRDVVAIFKYVVETDRRFYLCNQVDVKASTEAGDVFFEVSMTDAWVWDMYSPARFAKNVKVLTFKDVMSRSSARRTSTRRKPELRSCRASWASCVCASSGRGGTDKPWPGQAPLQPPGLTLERSGDDWPRNTPEDSAMATAAALTIDRRPASKPSARRARPRKMDRPGSRGTTPETTMMSAGTRTLPATE